jgi:NitT/TauT family transport system ATP-binding protein
VVVGESVINVNRISKVFSSVSGGEICALEDLSFDVRAREFITIVGPSGCGKSTLLRIVAGLLRPTAGDVHVSGNPVVGPIKGIGFVFQKPVLFDWLKVLANVLIPVDLAGLNKNDYVQKARDLLSLVKLDGFEDKYPGELSGGMQQRVSIARALILDPELLIMDEPFGALDALTRDDLNLELLKIWQEAQKTVLFVTHNIGEAILLGDRVLVFSERPGRITTSIPIDLERPRSIESRTDKRFGEWEVQIYNLIAAQHAGLAS